ncbi:hypothetical protein TNIN_80511 [Trichonephila inaurata madagascariensis]|uniref:BTB domain-containing protein n=1 Tax=Trichonephila inaurata madagascariensis TaxID=2747483 RepID=A0A8X7CS42_9ARAC|nr:hypothetical protein TNIN_80511 [Trichonephila inaurata madagascariensis]
MFSSKMQEIQKNEVVVTGIDAFVLRIMLAYIYTGKIKNLTVPLAGDLLFAADKYKLKGLKTACREYLKTNTSMENALEILTIGDLHDPDLKSFAIEFICKNCDDFNIACEIERKIKVFKNVPSGILGNWCYSSY